MNKDRDASKEYNSLDKAQVLRKYLTQICRNDYRELSEKQETRVKC